MEQFINLLQEFAFNVAVIALPILAGFLIALLNAWIKKVLAEVEGSKPDLYWALEQGAIIAVQAAEQMELAGFVGHKKDYAILVIQKYLDERGWNEVDVVVLEAAIEAAVFKTNRIE